MNAEPYYNEAGYERQRGTVEGNENSRMYNEMAVIKTMESVRNMLQRPSPVFIEEIQRHFKEYLPRFVSSTDVIFCEAFCTSNIGNDSLFNE